MRAYSASSTIHRVHAPTIPMVDNLIALIREANELLQKEVDLSPTNEAVTHIISQLSMQLRSYYSPDEIQFVLSNEYIRMNLRQLQHKLSEAEFLAELNDARDIYQSERSVLETLTRLPIWNIYKALVSEELAKLQQFTSQDNRAGKLQIIFVGSGPMPLSAIILHLLSDAKITCVEMNAVAYDASRSLLDRLGLADQVTVVMGNGSEFDYSSYSRIFVASLVHNKREVLERIIQTSADPLVAIRTAEGMRKIMYEAIDESQLSNQGWRMLGRTSPDENLVINSTVFLKRAHA